MSRLVLASASPRRRELLSGLGLDFDIRPVDIDESPRDGEAPQALVLRLAREKAAAIDSDDATDSLVLAADTLVVLDDRILGKPGDEVEAKAMLTDLQGRDHTVLTGVAMRDLTGEREAARVVATRVRIAPLDAARIDWYVSTGEPMDKAGAYAIQGLGALLVESIDGNYSNVVGLPLPAVSDLLAELGHDLLELRPS